LHTIPNDIENSGNNDSSAAFVNISQNRMNAQLQRIYFSKKCSYFYYSLLGLTVLLILVTIIDGFKIADSPMFIALEFLLNLFITLDFCFKVKMTGVQKFFKLDMQQKSSWWWNYFDAFVVLSCTMLFVGTVFAKHGLQKEIDESLEQLVMVIWAIWQILRVFLITKRQRLAKMNAMTMINFENIVVDTEFGGMTNRSIHLAENDDLP
jgi:hypothetical protein